MESTELLPTEERMHWILAHGAALIEGGAEPVRGLVQPTGEFFPDKFDKSPDSIGQLLRRVVQLAGLKHLKIRANLILPEGMVAGGGCASGACGVTAAPDASVQRVVETGKGYTVNIIANEVTNPVILLTAMVRAVSHIFLKEADLVRELRPAEYEHGIDLAGVLLGFGTLLCNGAYVYRKG